jgi:hypothetical protein
MFADEEGCREAACAEALGMARRRAEAYTEAASLRVAKRRFSSDGRAPRQLRFVCRHTLRGSAWR